MAPPAARAARSRTLPALAALLLASVSVLGLASTAAVADAPNHGTIKIDDDEFTTDDGNSNNPKPVGCDFRIDFYNFPTATPTATISFENKSPGPGTNADVSQDDLAGPRTVTFATSDGPANVLEHRSALFTVNPDGALQALPNGDILLKVTVELEGDPNFRKHKVLKVECEPVTGSPSPSPSVSMSPSPSPSPSVSMSPSPSPSVSLSPSPSASPVLVPDLAIDKGGPATATVGMVGSYTLTVRNVGTATVTEPVVVTDTLPAGVTPTAAAGDGFACTVVGQLVTCTGQGDLAPDASTSPITITVTFGQGAVPSVLNTARVAAVTGETELANNVDSHPTTVTVPVVIVEEKPVVQVVETVVPVQTVVQTPVMGPPTGLAPVVPVVLPELVGTSPDLPATLPLPALPLPAAPLPAAPLPALPLQALPQQAAVSLQPARAVPAAAQGRTLPFTGAPVEVLVPTGLLLLVAGVGALLIGSRGPRTAER